MRVRKPAMRSPTLARHRFAAGLLFRAASGLALPVLFGELVFDLPLPFGQVGFVDAVFDQRARHTDEVVHAFGLEGADLFARFDSDDLCVVGTHQEYFAAPVAADMRAYALHGDLFPGQLFRVGEQVVHLERRCGLCRFRRLFPVVRIAAASCGHERRRGDYQIYD